MHGTETAPPKVSPCKPMICAASGSAAAIATGSQTEQRGQGERGRERCVGVTLAPVCEILFETGVPVAQALQAADASQLHKDFFGNHTAGQKSSDSQPF